MPFKRNTSNADSDSTSVDMRHIFIGRTHELSFFAQYILQPSIPAHNILSISGHGGVGKSTLLAQYISLINLPPFRDYCHYALVNDKQATVVDIMGKFAEQFRNTGYSLKRFQEALNRYKEALHRLQARREAEQEVLLRGAMDTVGSVAENIPFLGGVLHKGTNTVTDLFIEKKNANQTLQDAKQLENPVEDLTKVFVDELNKLAATPATRRNASHSSQRRIILFFDAFERLGSIATPWLLDCFLELDIHASIVLVIAGRDSLEQAPHDESINWLPYRDNHILSSLLLESFTLEETRAYLVRRGIQNEASVGLYWRLSHGLPLYLGLLTSNPHAQIDPTKDVVANFLRWIPKQDVLKRRLVLDAALLSRPFHQDDLAAFPSLPEHERSALYTWLTSQPFIQSNPFDGRITYHELVRELFSRHLYHLSPNEWVSTRQSIATHYQAILQHALEENGLDVFRYGETIELAFALAYQFLLLPDDISHLKAVEYLLLCTHKYTERLDERWSVLRELAEEHPNYPVKAHAKRLLQLLFQYLEASFESQTFLPSVNGLIEHIAHDPSCPPSVLADLYTKRGTFYGTLRRYEQALIDFQHALRVHSTSCSAYIGRANMHRLIGHYQQALADYDAALALDAHVAAAYAGRGDTHRLLKHYEQAIRDYNQTLQLNPNYLWVYVRRGRSHFLQGQYQSAIADFDKALELDPQKAADYLQRGLAYLCLKNVKQAKDDFTRSWELNPTNVNHGWMIEWTLMCEAQDQVGMVNRLETIAAVDPQRYEAWVCRGVAHWLRHDYREALTQLEQAVPLADDEWDAYFWKGMTLIALDQVEEAHTSIAKSLEVGLPPILLAPLEWFKQDKPDIYTHYLEPFLREIEEQT